MGDSMKLYLFGDQTFDIQADLKSLLRCRQDPVLEDFLEKAYEALRVEIYSLPSEVRDDLPRFTSLDDLVLWKQDGVRCIALDMAVTCLYQLGAFISRADSLDFSATKSPVLGLCTGALAAAAVGCSRNTLELVPVAVDAVVVAFRTGMHVTNMAQRLQSSEASDKCWSMVVPGSASADAVAKFCETTTLPVSARPYVSAYAPNGVTVSGPPHSLELLAQSGVLRSGAKNIQIFAPYHAPHLYSPEDIDEIVGGLELRDATPRPSNTTVFSSTGDTVKTGDFVTLLKAAVGQILLQPIRWNAVLEELQACLTEGKPNDFSVIPIATKADTLIYTALKQTPLRQLLPSKPVQPQLPVAEDETNNNPHKPKLAIVGMSGRFPGAQDTDGFWDLLHEGLDVHKPVPALHWDAKTHVDPTGKGKNKSATAFGCWLDDPAGFDARFFNISPREAPQIDPAQRIALMTAYEAIEQAGIIPDATPSTRRDRVGVFYGVTSMDWMETNSAQNVDFAFIPGGNMAFIPGRINYFFKFSGPSYAVNTACSSSLAGIHLACNALWRGEIDTAIAGGTNVLTNPDMTAGLDKGHFLSRTGNCKTFDDSADGYCRGEGVGTVILKRLDDAVADKDPILGVVLGASTNHSAESESITRPHVGAQRAIFNKILNQGAVDPYSVGYVEMHGTGTQAGDAGEMSSVLDTFAPPLDKVKAGRTSDESLFLGSAKANVGHGEAASGMASLLKVLLMMQKNTIVPHAGIKTKINHRFPTDLDERKVMIAREPTPWERSEDPSKPRRAFVNNFSAAGGNSALLIEDAPLQSDPANDATDSRSHHVVAVSAKNGASLQGNLQTMLDFLKHNSSVNLGQLSYTTTARRIHHQHRVMLTGKNIEEICGQIDTAIKNQVGMTRPKSAPKVVFTFTGQGAQYPGMGKELLDNFSLFRNEMRQMDRIAQSQGFPSMLPVLESEEQDIGKFSPTAVQLASVCMQIALSRLWASWNITPVAVVGHSLGEYAALNVSGVLSDADTIHLVGSRATLLQKKCTKDTHSMLVVKGSVDEVANVLKDHKYEIACINSPSETVLAGVNEDISTFKNVLTEAGVKTTLLKVPYAFHSSQIEPILEDFKECASGVIYSDAKVPILCPLDGNVVGGDGEFGPDYLARHAREPVNMQKALLTANSQHILGDQATTLEIGPHPAISGMVRAVLGTQLTNLASLQRGRSTFQMLTTALKTLYTAGSDIRWSAYHDDFKASQKVIPMPAYSWDLKPYWMQYVNDWSLRKGDPPLTITNAPKLETTTIHRVVEESGDDKKSKAIVEADVTRKDFRPLVEGHEVDGVPLCTPAVYAEIALSLGTYLLERYNPGLKNKKLEIADMTILKALILRADGPQQLLQAHADVDWSSGSAMVKFMTFDSQQKLQEHSHCTVRYTDNSLQQKLQKDLPSIKNSLKALQDGIMTGTTSRFNRPMVYRSIRPLARFHDDYRAVDEIVMNSKTLEASSQLSFGSFKKEGNFHTHPALLDALTWCAGFSMNCNDYNDLDREVFVNHGWGSFQMFEPLDFAKEYTTYSRMVEGADKLWTGDVLVLDGEKIIAHFGKFAMQGVPRRVLRVILAKESGQKMQTQAKPAPKKEQVNASVVSQKLEKATKEPVPAKKASGNSDKLEKALAIISEESGIAVADLTDGTNFGDVGIDSLLGLTISARFKEEIELDIDFNAFFYEYPTVGELKAFLGESNVASTAGTSTPESSEDTPGETAGQSSATSVSADDAPTPQKFDFGSALKIISEESGVAPEDLTDDTNFADSGVDSLLSLVIVSRFRDELELDIQHESLFLECPTVADLKQALLGTSGPGSDAAAPEAAPEPAKPTQAPAKTVDVTSRLSESERAELATRKQAVDEYVQKYTAGWTAPVPSSSSSTTTNGTAKTVLVTGASGSLGSHLVHHLAQLPDVARVVCLNRENRTAEAWPRQQKAMRSKGIHFPAELEGKLLVLQTDGAKPRLGLDERRYADLAASVTHIVHQAWPMSVKRPLAGFEPQFAVLRNLLDLASGAVARRPAGFRFAFQFVSSISVVGNYGRTQEKVRVPEERVGVDALLPVGYAEAKWGCERMLDATLHRHPDRFRPMTVRLGQIAGSKTSGYWNPMEHFGFLVKSSQTLRALPDVEGDVFWTPVNDIAGALADLVLRDGDKESHYPVYHIENPVGQPWPHVTRVLADALGITDLVSLEEWTDRVRKAPQRNNPASTLVEFLDKNYKRMSCGGLVLDAKHTVEHSPTLAKVGPVSDEVVRKYVHIWKEIGFLN